MEGLDFFNKFDTFSSLMLDHEFTTLNKPELVEELKQYTRNKQPAYFGSVYYDKTFREKINKPEDGGIYYRGELDNDDCPNGYGMMIWRYCVVYGFFVDGCLNDNSAIILISDQYHCAAFINDLHLFQKY